MGGSTLDKGSALTGAGRFSQTETGRKFIRSQVGASKEKSFRRGLEFFDPGGAIGGSTLSKERRSKVKGRIQSFGGKGRKTDPEPLPASPQRPRTAQRVNTANLLRAAGRRSTVGVAGTRRTSPLGITGDRAPTLRRRLGE